MKTGSGAKVAAAVELFKVGASGSSESSRTAGASAGSLESCRTQKADAESPPDDCHAPLRVELIPIVDKPAAAEKAGGGGEPAQKKSLADNAPPDAKDVPIVAEENPCRPGYVLTRGICSAAKDTAFLCDKNEPAVCKTQCDKGDLGSCFNYGAHQHELGRNKKAEESPVPYFQKACEGGHAAACGAWGRELSPHFDRADAATYLKAIELEKKACDGADGNSCWWYGSMLQLKDAPNTTPVDEKAAFRAFVHGCSLADISACRSASWAYMIGKGVTKDFEKGIQLSAKACASGNTQVCLDVATELTYGNHGLVPVDKARALTFAKKVCDQPPDAQYSGYQSAACELTCFLMLDLGKSDEALKYATAACDMKSGQGCYPLYELYSSKGPQKNPAKATEISKRICDDEILKTLDGMRGQVGEAHDQPICKGAAPKPAAKPKGKPKKR